MKKIEKFFRGGVRVGKGRRRKQGDGSCSTPLYLQDVLRAADVHIQSRESFTRRFTACTGITPKQLIDRFVTGRCLTLLGRNCTLKEIAETLRFRDEFAFSRYFKRNMGESPRDWRRRNRSHPAG